MGIMEILFLVFGIAIFIASFVIPEMKHSMNENDKRISEKEIHEIIESEMDAVKNRISDIIDETIDYSVEKTERALERLSNEKIIAVNEYSDTVLTEINKYHKEILFLYDMLNDKQRNLKETAQAVTKTANEAKQAVKNVIKDSEAMQLEVQSQIITSAPESITEEVKTESFHLDSNRKEISNQQIRKMIMQPEVHLTEEDDIGENSNGRILQLHKEGKTHMQIAKELGLGMGEIKLVVDLFEGSVKS